MSNVREGEREEEREINHNGTEGERGYGKVIWRGDDEQAVVVEDGAT